MAPRKRARTDAAAASAPAAAARYQHSTNLPSFAGLYESGELCDGEAVHQGATQPVCCMLLAGSSSFCKAALCRWQTAGAKPRVTIDASLSSQCVAALLRFAHTGSLEVADSEAENLLVAADQLGFAGVPTVAAEHLKATLSPESCISRLALATRHSADALGEAAIKVAGEHWAAVAASPAFLALDRDALTLLLRSDELCAEEVEIYEAMLAWHGANGGEFAPLLELIRLSELGFVYLMTHVNHSQLVVASACAQTLVQEAAIYLNAAPAERAALASARTRPRRGKSLGITADDPVRVEGNSLVVGSHVAFRVWPEGAEGDVVAHDMQPFTLQPGEQIVSRADPDFDVVKEMVIVAFGWSALVLAVRRGEADAQGFSAFWTKNAAEYGKTPGTVAHENDSNKIGRAHV